MASASDTPGGRAITPEERVRKWDEALDKMDYFQLLKLERPKVGGPPFDDSLLRTAFKNFATFFYPDSHANASPETREAVTRIFRRGNEAHRVLQNQALRDRYVAGLAAGKLRMTPEEIAKGGSSQRMEAVKEPQNNAPSGSIESLAAGPAALQHARQADLFMAKGDVKQALLQVHIAAAKEPLNSRLKAKLAELTAKAKAK